MTAPRRVSVAVLSWNGRQHLETCLTALAEQDDPGVEWEVLVLDNGSTDGTGAWLGARYPQGRLDSQAAPAAPEPRSPAPSSSPASPPRSSPSSLSSPAWRPAVRWFASPVNLGFCAGNNRLVEAASGDAVALLNNDTRPSRGWLAALVRALAAAPADVAAVSGKIVDWDGERLDFGRGVMTFDGHAFQLDFRRPLRSARVPERGEELLFACGGNMLIRRASFLAAGGFDESYFAYLEDVDLGWRLWSGGERVTFEPEAVVHHRSNATSDLLGLFNRGFLFERNAFLTAYKNYEPGLWEKVMPALLLTFLSRTQTMLADNNPGGGSLRIDPYAGWIANTAAPAPASAAAAPATGAADARLPASAPPLSLAAIGRKWREHGTRELCRRAAVKLRARLRAVLPAGADGGRGRPKESAPRAPILTDERTVAQLRALSYLLAHLEAAAAAREAVQRRRRRSDREIFARFPPYLVPTYPGDQFLFASPGFTAWLPAELPLVRHALDEIMELDPPGDGDAREEACADS
ncbi:MAG TPA: glycosyltransferase family 2 protein [Thermoanaerobaculia bacterium]|jgi:GT2 family glycosyltransferase|nr:glycosyltransferase family 2 protein [Thermoanaerobaculia bacterium]